MTIDIANHNLVPKHSVLSDKEKEKLFEQYKVNSNKLPKILKEDPAVAKLSVKVGDVIKIERDSETAGKTVYYRVVIDG